MVHTVDQLQKTINGLRKEVEDLHKTIKAEKEKKGNETHFQQLAENILEAFWLITTTSPWKIIYANPAFQSVWGLPANKANEDYKSVTQAIHKDDQKKVNFAFQNFLTGKEDYNIEFRIVLADGTVNWIWSRYFGIDDDSGKMYRAAGIAQDITKRKLVEEALLLSKKRYKELFNNSPIPLWEEDFKELFDYLEKLNSKGISDVRAHLDNNPDELKACTQKVKIIDVNRAALKLHEANSKEQLLGNLDKIFTQRSFDVFKEEIIAIASGLTKFRTEGEIKTLNGEHKQVLVDLKIDTNWPETCKAYLATTDITEQKLLEAQRKSMEEDLRESRQMLQLVLDTIPVRVFWKDLNSNYLGCNQHFAHDAGRMGPEEMIGDNDYNMGWAEQAELYVQDDKTVIKSDKPKINYEEPQTTPEGKTIWLRTSKIPLKNKNGKTIGLLGTYEEITEQKVAETALRESEEKYRHLIENSGEAIYLLYGRRFEIINTEFVKLFGLSIDQANAPGFDFISLVAPESKKLIEKQIIKQLAGKELEPNYEFVALNAKGNKILVEATVTRIKYKDGFAIQGIIRDISEKRSLENQLLQVQKMDAVGVLAGGIAHDFNNLLTVINGYAQITLSRLEDESPLRKTINPIFEAGKKAANLTSQLLAFSRKQVFKSEILDINSVIKDMDKMLRRLIGEDISIETIFAKNLAKIKADKSQLEQIFMNLLLNARDAVYAVGYPEYQRKITIETGKDNLTEEYVKTHPGSSRGEHVFISVSDNGIGINEEVKKKIFEPFFTTKDKFKGTGLGLSTVYGIVKQNNGYINVYSEPKHGTVFKIYWPISTVMDEVVSGSDKMEDFSDLTGNESILIVEDDLAVGQFAYDALSSLGYKVTKAANGKLALDLIKNKKNKYDLIVSDLIMPELNGKEFIQKAKKIIPDLKVIFVSGYTDNHVVHNGMLEDDINFIQKPYSAKILAETVRQVLDAG